MNAMAVPFQPEVCWLRVICLQIDHLKQQRLGCKPCESPQLPQPNLDCHVELELAAPRPLGCLDGGWYKGIVACIKL